MTKDKVYKMEMRMNCVRIAQEILRPIITASYVSSPSYPPTSPKNPSAGEILATAQQIYGWINK